jgi:hypothetical protein
MAVMAGMEGGQKAPLAFLTPLAADHEKAHLDSVHPIALPRPRCRITRTLLPARTAFRRARRGVST